MSIDLAPLLASPDPTALHQCLSAHTGPITLSAAAAGPADALAAQLLVAVRDRVTFDAPSSALCNSLTALGLGNLIEGGAA